MEPDDEILGRARVTNYDEFVAACSKFGEGVDNWDCSDSPLAYPANVIFIKSTYCGITTMEKFFHLTM